MLNAPSKLFNGGQRQPPEHGHPVQQVDVEVPDADQGPVHPTQPPPRRYREDRTEQTDRYQRSPHTGPVDHHRREDRSDADGQHDQALQHSEHAGQHLVGDQPGQQRETGQVDEGVPDADAPANRANPAT